MRKLRSHSIRGRLCSSIVNLNRIDFGLKDTILRPGKHVVSIGRNTRGRYRWRHRGNKGKSRVLWREGSSSVNIGPMSKVGLG